MSLPFSVLVARACAREPHRSALSVANEISAKLNAARKLKREQKNERAAKNREKLYATKSSWSSGYENY